MAITPAPIFLKFREQLTDPFGSVLDQVVGTINQNFRTPLAPTGLGLTLVNDFPSPFREEFQQLQAGINLGFANVKASRFPAPVALQFREQLPEPLGSELESVVGMINVGLRNLFP